MTGNPTALKRALAIKITILDGAASLWRVNSSRE